MGYGVDYEMTSFDYAVCRQQAFLFATIQEEYGYDPEDFIEKYMNSEIARRMDSSYDPVQWLMSGYTAEATIKEVGYIKKSNKKHNFDALYWMGYVYRYWHYYQNMSSKEIYEIADFQYVYDVYGGFHTLDPGHAIDIMMEQNLKKKKHKK